MRRVLVLALIASGCGEKEPVDSDDLPPIGNGGDDSADCEGADPEALSLTLANGGVQQFDDGPSPTFELRIEAADADGNLDYVTMEAWFEPADDGEVSTSGDPDIRSTFTIRDEPCDVDTADLVLRVQVGGALSYDTRYDVAARFLDSTSAASNVVAATGTTPTESGEDGGGA